MTTTTTTIATEQTDETLAACQLDDGLQDLGVPVSIQTFLWRQITPFIRPKLGKLHETTCMVMYIY